jgi:fucose permease
MTLTNILINLDHGILPACTNELKEAFDMNESELGFLGSIVYLGIVLMGLFAGRLYLRINSKMLTVAALVALEVSLLLFVLSDRL